MEYLYDGQTSPNQSLNHFRNNESSVGVHFVVVTLEQENKETLAMLVKGNIPWGIFSRKLIFSFHLVNMAADQVFESRTFNIGHFRSCFHSPKN